MLPAIAFSPLRPALLAKKGTASPPVLVFLKIQIIVDHPVIHKIFVSLVLTMLLSNVTGGRDWFV